MKILIPTLLPLLDIAPMIRDIQATAPGCDIFASCTKASASVNRNICLDQIAVGETAIMLDDDISGFTPNWVDDLLVGLTIPNAVMVSARLLNPDGTFGPTCAEVFDQTPDEIVLTTDRRECVMPTAAIAFAWSGERYDSAFVGSGFEDNDLMAQILQRDPSAVFVQSNRCRLIHRNECKEQKGSNWEHNQRYFWSKWPNGVVGAKQR